MRHMIHKLICWYLRRCGGAFHSYPYGETGRYVVLMSEREYSQFQHNRAGGLPSRVVEAMQGAEIGPKVIRVLE